MGFKMLPFLEELKITNYLPILRAELKINNNNLFFQSNHGGGKTTLCDLLAFSLLREHVYERRKAYFHSRVNSNENEHIIESIWNFGKNDKLSIKHKINLQRMYTYLENEETSKSIETYNNIILNKTRLNLEEFSEFFRFLYQIDELDHHPFLTEENFNKRIFNYLKEIMIDEKTNEKISSLRIDKKKLEDLLKEKDNEITNLLQSSNLLSRFPNKQNTLMLKQEEIEKINIEIQKINRHIDEYESELEKINQEKSSINEKKTNNLIAISKSNSEVEVLENLIKNIDNELNTFQNFFDKIKQEISISQHCKLCGNNIFENWDRINNNKCPICGLDLPKGFENLDDKQITDNHRKILEERKKGLEEEVASKKLSNNNLEVEKNEITRQIKEIEKNRNDYRDLLKGKNKELSEKQKQLGEEEKELNLIKEYLTVDIDNKYQELNSNLSEYKEKLRELQEKISNLENKKDNISELLDCAELFWEQLYKKFVGGNVSINFKERTLKSDGKKRYLENTSGAEKHISNLLLKISFWNCLMRFEKAEKGLIIIDSPIVYSDIGIEKLYEIIESEDSKNIIFIITLPKGISSSNKMKRINPLIQLSLDSFFEKLKNKEASN
jgi:predicted DNA-binding WGR domain protein